MERVEKIITDKMNELEEKIWESVERQKEGHDVEYWRHMESSHIHAWTELKNVLEEIRG